MRLTRMLLSAIGGVTVIAILGAVLISALGGESEGNAVAAETDATRTLSISGEGRVSVPPDIVMTTLGVDIRNEDLGTAQIEATETMNDVIAALKNNGIAEQDIQTANYFINVERDYNQQTQPIIGYIVSHTVTAKVRDISKAGAVLEAAIDAGANNVQGIWFALENPGDAVKQAREQALADARAKAEHLAGLADATLGPIQSISEGFATPPPPIPFEGRAMMDMAVEESAALAPSINPGQSEVVVTVAVTYAIQ